jgi:integrase
MKKRKSRRNYGSIRTLPSGKKQARVPDPITGKSIPLGTYDTIDEADAAIAEARSQRRAGKWIDPRKGQVLFGPYSTEWLTMRTDLSPRTAELYEGLLRLHIVPRFGKTQLGDISTPAVREWRSTLLAGDKPGSSTVAKAYRLLRTILNTALEDRFINENPCKIKNAGKEEAAERPTATVNEVYALADAIGDSFRAVVIVAAFSGLRKGEILGLTRRNFNLARRELTVEQQLQELKDGSFYWTKPKSHAGYRTITLPVSVMQELKEHLERYPVDGVDSLIFRQEDGQPISRAVIDRAWRKARKAVNMEHLHFHDLRHTGQEFAVDSGASGPDLKKRMGHSSDRASARYMHASRKRDAAIADAIEDRIQTALGKPVAPIVPLAKTDEI